MPSQVNPDYILPNYRPNYRVPQTRTVRTPAQPNPRDTYDYFAEQRELNRVRQEQIAAANRRMQALMAQRRVENRRTSYKNQQQYLPGSVPFDISSPYGGNRQLQNWWENVTQKKPQQQPAWIPIAQRKPLNYNYPERMRNAIASGQISPLGYDPYEVGGAAYGSVGDTWNNIVNRRAKDKAEWDAIFNMPRETLAELIARGAVDPWASDPYEIGGSPYAESVYNEQYAEDTGWDGYGGWGSGWGGGGGSYSSSPGIYGDSVRKNQWYSTLLQWNIT